MQKEKNLESIGRRQELLPRSLEEGRKTTRAAAFALAEATPSIDPKMKATKNKRVELSKNIDRYHFFSNLFFVSLFLCRVDIYYSTDGPTECRPMTCTHQVYFNSRPLGERTDS